MKGLWILISLLLLVAPSALTAEQKSGGLQVSEETRKYFRGRRPDITLSFGEYKLLAFVISKGNAKEEGYHGILFKDRVEITGSEETLEFNNARLSYYGPYVKREFTYDRSGWLPNNLKMLDPKYSLSQK